MWTTHDVSFIIITQTQNCKIYILYVDKHKDMYCIVLNQLGLISQPHITKKRMPELKFITHQLYTPIFWIKYQFCVLLPRLCSYYQSNFRFQLKNASLEIVFHQC